MTSPTDPRVEAAARAMCRRESGYLYSKDKQQWENRSWGLYKERASDSLKAADEAGWRPIEGVKDCPLAALIEQGSDEGPYIGSCRDGVWCDGLDMVEPTHYMPLPELPAP